MADESFIQLQLRRNGVVERVLWDPEGMACNPNFPANLGCDLSVWSQAVEESITRHKAVQRTFQRGKNLPAVRFKFKPTARGLVTADGTLIPPRGQNGLCTSLEGAVMGWAHDLNNLFTIMSQAIDLMEHKARSGKDTDQELMRLRRGALKARNITDWIVRIMKGSSIFESMPFAATLVVEEMVDLLRASTRGVSLELKVDPRCHRAIVFGVPEDLARVLFNLCVNAYHAAEEGKRSRGTVSVRLVMVDSRRGQMLRVEIADDGPGMEDQEIKRILYHGTSSPRGHGIGISVVKDLVRQLGGTIDATSHVGRGTRFTVDLPVLKEWGCEEDVERRGDERIGLLMPKRHAKLYGSFLLSWGYRVFEIPSEEHLEQYQDELHLLIAWQDTPLGRKARTVQTVTFGEEGSGADFILPVTRNDMGRLLSSLDQAE